MDRFDPFVKYADVYGDIINWEKDPMNKPQNQNKYFFSDGKVSLTALAEVHEMSLDKIRYRIKLAKKKLKEYYDLHEKMN